MYVHMITMYCSREDKNANCTYDENVLRKDNDSNSTKVCTYILAMYYTREDKNVNCKYDDNVLYYEG